MTQIIESEKDPNAGFWLLLSERVYLADTLGRYHPTKDVIWIRSGMTPKLRENVLAHETVHVSQREELMKLDKWIPRLSMLLIILFAAMMIALQSNLSSLVIVLSAPLLASLIMLFKFTSSASRCEREAFYKSWE